MRTPCSVLCVLYWKHWKALEARTASDVQTLCLISSGYTSAICSSMCSRASKLEAPDTSTVFMNLFHLF